MRENGFIPDGVHKDHYPCICAHTLVIGCEAFAREVGVEVVILRVKLLAVKRSQDGDTCRRQHDEGEQKERVDVLAEQLLAATRKPEDRELVAGCAVRVCPAFAPELGRPQA